jgi:hypothetical protein
MVFPRKNPAAPPVRQTTLMEETEKLITKLVKNARSGRVTRGADGVRHRVPYDALDQARAVSAALEFLKTKEKLDPEVTKGEFDAGLEAYHNARVSHPPDDDAEGAARDHPPTAH